VKNALFAQQQLAEVGQPDVLQWRTAVAGVAR
jgi:hypothetical protein